MRTFTLVLNTVDDYEREVYREVKTLPLHSTLRTYQLLSEIRKTLHKELDTLIDNMIEDIKK